MYGAILGDIVGSPYEFDCNNYKAKDFPLFSRHSDFTDDTVMTLAVAKALLSSCGQDDAAIKAALVREMQQLGCAYPDRGYGTHFVVTCAGEKDGRGGGLCALDALRVVVGHLGGEPRQTQRFRHICCQPCGR